MARFMVKASEYKNVCKAVNDRKLAELKKEIIEILKQQDEKEFKKAVDLFESQEMHYSHLEKSITGKWVEKAGYGVGTVRIWKGKKYKKIAPGKWARVFDKEGRGTNIAIGKLIAKVQKINNVEDLMALVMANKQRFVDENGVDLPVLDKLRAAVDARNGNVGSKEIAENNFTENDIQKLKKKGYSLENLRKKGWSDEEIKEEFLKDKKQLNKEEIRSQVESGYENKSQEELENDLEYLKKQIKSDDSMTVSLVGSEKMPIKDAIEILKDIKKNNNKKVALKGTSKPSEKKEENIETFTADDFRNASREKLYDMIGLKYHQNVKYKNEIWTVDAIAATGHEDGKFQLALLQHYPNGEIKNRKYITALDIDKVSSIEEQEKPDEKKEEDSKAYEGKLATQKQVDEATAISNKYEVPHNEMLKMPVTTIQKYANSTVEDFEGGIDKFIEYMAEGRSEGVSMDEVGKEFAKLINHNVARKIWDDYESGALVPDEKGILKPKEESENKKVDSDIERAKEKIKQYAGKKINSNEISDIKILDDGERSGFLTFEFKSGNDKYKMTYDSGFGGEKGGVSIKKIESEESDYVQKKRDAKEGYWSDEFKERNMNNIKQKIAAMKEDGASDKKIKAYLEETIETNTNDIPWRERAIEEGRIKGNQANDYRDTIQERTVRIENCKELLKEYETGVKSKKTIEDETFEKPDIKSMSDDELKDYEAKLEKELLGMNRNDPGFADKYNHWREVHGENNDRFHQRIEDDASAEKQAEADAKSAKEKEINEKYNGYFENRKGLDKARDLKTLEKKYNFDGKVMSSKDFVEQAIDNGAEIKEREVNKLDYPSRTRWNRMNGYEQEQYERRIKEAGKKTVYSINGFEFPKTVVDYAKYYKENGKKGSGEEKSSLSDVAIKNRAHSIASAVAYSKTYQEKMGAPFNMEVAESIIDDADDMDEPTKKAVREELKKLYSERKVQKSLDNQFLMDMFVEDEIQKVEEEQEEESLFDDYSAEQPELFNSTTMKVQEAFNRCKVL